MANDIELATPDTELARHLISYPEGSKMLADGYLGEWWRLMTTPGGQTYLESISDRSLSRRLSWAYAGDISVDLAAGAEIALKDALARYLSGGYEAAALQLRMAAQ